MLKYESAPGGDLENYRGRQLFWISHVCLKDFNISDWVSLNDHWFCLYSDDSFFFSNQLHVAGPGGDLRKLF